MSVQAVSKHLKVLERAGLIKRGREAQWRPSRLDPAPLNAAIRVDRSATARLATDRMDRLDAEIKKLRQHARRTQGNG